MAQVSLQFEVREPGFVAPCEHALAFRMVLTPTETGL